MKRKTLGRLTEKLFGNWPVVVSIILLIGVFVSALLVYFQSTAISGPFSTLLAYCHNLEAQNYPAAYALLDDASRGQFSADDFALFAAQNNGAGRVSDCRVQDVRILHTSNNATGKIDFSYSKDGSRSLTYMLNRQGSGWKLAHIVVSSPAAVLVRYCQAITARDYHAAYMFWSKDIRTGLSEADFAQKFTSAFVAHCKAASAHEHEATATATITYAYSSGASALYIVQLINEDGRWFLNEQQQV